MAIAYNAKLVESTSATTTVAVTTTSAAKAGSLIVVAYGGKAASSLSGSSVTDSNGNTYTRHQRASSLAAIGIAYTRTASALASGATITLTWNTAPTVSWVSVHAFEGASGTATDTDTNTGVGTTATATVNVSGSDWLTFAVVGLPYDWSVAGESGANSSTLRDDNNKTGSGPWLQCSSRNGTSGATHSPGVVYGVSVDWYAVSVSWPYQAMPTGGNQNNSALWAV